MTSIWYRVHMYVGSYDEKFLKVFVLYPTIFFVFEETLTSTFNLLPTLMLHGQTQLLSDVTYLYA